MDQGSVDIIKSLGGAAIMWGAIFSMFLMAKKPLMDRIPILRELGPAKFFEAMKEQSQTSSSAPLEAAVAVAGIEPATAPALLTSTQAAPAASTTAAVLKKVEHAEGVLPAALTPETEDLVRRLVNGWRFERTFRVIFVEQIALLREALKKKTLTAKDANEFYMRMNPEYRKAASVDNFVLYLQNERLLTAAKVGNGIAYTPTLDAEFFIAYIDAVAKGVIWPGVSNLDPKYRWGSKPLPQFQGDPAPPQVLPPLPD